MVPRHGARTSLLRHGIDPIRAFVKAHPWWHTALLLFGALALITVFSTLFLAIGETPRELSASDEIAPVESPAFAESLVRLVNAASGRGGTVTVLNNGDGFLPALLEDLDAAERTINFSVFIWSDGTFSDQVLDALVRAARRGVAVRVLLDGLGARDVPDRAFAPLRDAGGRVEKFRTPQFGRLTRFHRRNHRRAIVIDDRVGFTGGMAVADEWLGNAEDPGRWRDVMFRLTGPLASSLQAAFVGAWASSSGEILLAGSAHGAPPDPPAGVERFIHHVHSPAEDDLSMAYFLMLPMLAARESLYIATPYFIPDSHMKGVLTARARAGVDVRLLLPGDHIDHQMARLSAQNHYQELLEAGVRIFEYRPTFLHSKFIVVDGRWSVLGSPNVNSRSRRLDEENAFGILDGALGAELAATFLADQEEADEIDLGAWRRRSPWRRLVQRLAQVLDQQS